MHKSVSDILGAGALTESAKVELQEAFEARLQEQRDEVTAELREEFATRYEADKSQIVEAMDAMLKNTLVKEFTEFEIDRKAVIAERVKYKKAMTSHTKILESFINKVLTTEIRELREDRKTQKTDFKLLESFVLKQLSGELNEFHKDKRALVEREVKMVKEGKAKIAAAKKEFIKEATATLRTLIEGTMRKEITSLRESIQTAKENEFGRKIFETFASEFMVSTLSEGTQVGKLSKKITGLKAEIAESAKATAETKAKLSESNRRLRVAKDLSERKGIMSEMLKPLTRSQSDLMGNLLESVATTQLRNAYTKYLPNVLAENKTTVAPRKIKITESASPKKVLTGNRQPSVQSETGGSADIKKLKTLAGIK
jgi:hypothetical protein